VGKLLERLKRSVRKNAKRGARDRSVPRHRDPDYYQTLGKEIAQASPERAGELAGHPIERRDT
jgi:hypothetical protein